MSSREEWDKWVGDSIGKLEARLNTLEKLLDKRGNWVYNEIHSLRNSVINIIKPLLTVQILKELEALKEATRYRIESEIGVDFKADRHRYYAFDEAFRELLESGQIVRIGHGRGHLSTYRLKEEST